MRLSQDPLLVEKVRDIVGLYMSPPDNAVVLCIDEKSQIQALERVFSSRTHAFSFTSRRRMPPG